MKKSMAKSVLMVAALLLISSVSEAGTFKESYLINGQVYGLTRVESTSFNGVKSVSCTGTLSTAPGQSVVNTYILYTLPHGATGSAMGTVNNTAKTYTDAIGDPQLNQYYLKFTVQVGTNKYIYYSPTYTFGKQ